MPYPLYINPGIGGYNNYPQPMLSQPMYSGNSYNEAYSYNWPSIPTDQYNVRNSMYPATYDENGYANIRPVYYA